jgi:uncharacterized RDD family membrane protein YckC
MSNTLGQVCPYCQFPVKPGDAYVVCSQCGVTHHQACWEANNHCTTFGCLGQALAPQGTPNTTVAPPPVPPAAPYFAVGACPRCQHTNLADAQFCASCGQRLSPVKPPTATPPPSNYSQPYSQEALVLYPKASLWPRFLASLVDGLIAGVPVFPGLVLLESRSTEVIGMLITMAAAVWCLFYSYTKDGRPGGQSIGKRMNELMVVHLPTNLPCNKTQSAIRTLIMHLTGFVPFIGGFIEPVLVLTTSQGTRLGDRVAKTQVIDVRHYRRA